MDEWASAAIAGLWTAFLATHVGLSSQRWRPGLVRRLGPTGFLGVYSLVSLALFIPLVWIYAQHKHAGAFLWYGSVFPWMRPGVYIGIALAMTLIVGSFFDPSPASIAPGSGAVRGVLRVTRHPLFMGVGLLGFLHLFVARVHTSDLIFFAGLPIVGLIGCWHQDRRKQETEGEAFQAFLSETSFLPFGRGGVKGLIESPTALVLGIGLTVLLRWFHPQIFGGSA
jgi:uncharacterized membrane protein